MQGEVAALQKDLRDLRKESKTKNARDEAKLKNEIDTSRIVMEKLRTEIDRLCSERDDLKNEVERRGASKQQKKREFERLKLQVKKLEKTLGKSTKSGQIPETVSAYQEERDRNEVCVVDYNTTYYVKGLTVFVIFFSHFSLKLINLKRLFLTTNL